MEKSPVLTVYSRKINLRNAKKKKSILDHAVKKSYDYLFQSPHGALSLKIRARRIKRPS